MTHTMNTKDLICHSKVKLERCEQILDMFKSKFKAGDKTFTKDRQAAILLEWQSACTNHRNEINELSN